MIWFLFVCVQYWLKLDLFNLTWFCSCTLVRVGTTGSWCVMHDDCPYSSPIAWCSQAMPELLPAVSQCPFCLWCAIRSALAIAMLSAFLSHDCREFLNVRQPEISLCWFRGVVAGSSAADWHTVVDAPKAHLLNLCFHHTACPSHFVLSLAIKNI